MFLTADELWQLTGLKRKGDQARFLRGQGYAVELDANLHDLRRKRLTDLARERGLDFAQQLAAHSDPRMTQSYVSGEARVAI